MIKIFGLLMLLVTTRLQDPLPELEVTPGEKFTLKAGQKAMVRGTGLTVQFAGVPHDSRCPEGVQCIWQGNGAVNLLLKWADGKLLSVLVNTGIEPHEAGCGGREVSLIRLSPNTKPDVMIDPNDYEATLVVKRQAPASSR